LFARPSPPLLLIISLAALALSGNASARDVNSEPTVVEDPHFGEVLYHFYQEDYFPAIVRLMAAKEQQQLSHHSDESELLLGGMFLSYGHHLRAAEIFEQLLADNVNVDVRDRVWFFLGKIWQQRGYFDKAEEAFANIENPLPDTMEAERRMLTAQLMIDSGRHESAIDLLNNWREQSGDTSEWAQYASFNLAVAMVRDGQVDRGTELLNALGQIDPYTEELSSLRDKANLALGYAHLQADRPEAAKAPLQRVRLKGPFSNKALLGVGWADAEVEDFSRAIVPWMELQGRSLLDAAVQESMLAIPYAMVKLDSTGQAADHYLNAIEAYDEESNRIDRMIGVLESGEMFEQLLAQDSGGTTGWYWQLDELPDGPESRYLFHLLSTHEFQEGLKNYRDLVYLADNLDDWQDSVDVYQGMLETREIAYEQRLPRVNASLAAADLDGMVAHKLELDAQVKMIEEEQDALGLASEREVDLWLEIRGLEQTRAARADLPEADAVRDKLRLLKGVLQWDMEREFKARLARIKRSLRDTGEALVETRRSRRQVDTAMREEPLQFQAFGQRVGRLIPRIDTTRERVYGAMDRQRAFLQTIAVDELLAQKERLDTYTVQARFALAALYDLSSTTVGDRRE